MSFDYPLALLAFLIFIPMSLLDIFSKKYKDAITPPLKKRLKISSGFFRLFLACAIIAIACPRWGTTLAVSEFRRGLDIVFAIDVSRSMDIHDTLAAGGGGDSQHSRLERGLLIASQTVHNVPGARYATAIGRSRGYLAVPLTWNNEAALSFLAALNPSYMIGRSTNLEALVDAASNAFQGSSPARRVIVLISDGEEVSGSIARALNRCISEGIIINAVALGSDEGRPILAESGNPDSPMVVSRRDSALMRNVAERTGGIFIDGNRDDAAVILSNHLLSLAHETGPGRTRQEPQERRTLFIVLAILAYGASKFFPLLYKNKKGILKAAALGAIVITLTGCSEGKLLLIEANYLHSRGRFDEALIPFLRALEFEDSAPYAEYGLGVTFHLLDEGRAALSRFESSRKMLKNFPSSEHRELRFRNYYNSGIIFFEEGDFESAALFFRKALREDHRRIEAKRNLELSLMSISKQTGETRSEDPQQEETREILFDYIRQQEEQRWQSREWMPEERYLGPDY